MRYFVIVFFVLSACAEKNYAPPDERIAPKQEACAAKFSNQICVSYTWELRPTEEEFGSFLFQTYKFDENGASILSDVEGQMAVVLWMPSMGHGSSPVIVERLGVGRYRASEVFFSMKGEWDIRFQMKVNDEVKDQTIIPIAL